MFLKLDFERNLRFLFSHVAFVHWHYKHVVSDLLASGTLNRCIVLYINTHTQTYKRTKKKKEWCIIVFFISNNRTCALLLEVCIKTLLGSIGIRNTTRGLCP